MPPNWPDLLARLDGRSRIYTYEIKPVDQFVLNESSSAPAQPQTAEEAAAAEEALAAALAKSHGAGVPILKAARRARRK